MDDIEKSIATVYKEHFQKIKFCVGLVETLPLLVIVFVLFVYLFIYYIIRKNIYI